MSLLHKRKLVALPVAAGAAIEAGQLVCTDANGMAVPASDLAGLTFHGFCTRGLDNTQGADGIVTGLTAERSCDADYGGPHEVSVEGPTPKPGQMAFIVDANTCQAAPNTSGLFAGRFLQPAMTPGKFYVEPQGAI